MPLTPINIKKYIALLTQDGTTANPTQTILQNTIQNENATLERSSEGNYTITFTENSLPENQTTIIMGSANAGSMYSATRINSETIGITTTVTGSATDGVLNNTTIEIQVYHKPIQNIL